MLAFSPPSLPGSTGGPPMQFVIRTTGDYQTLAGVALKMQQAARESGLFLFTDGDLKFDTPEYVVTIDADKANRIGVSMQDVGAALATMLGGNYVNLFNLAGPLLSGHSAGAARFPPDAGLADALSAAHQRAASSRRCRRWRASPKRCSPTR